MGDSRCTVLYLTYRRCPPTHTHHSKGYVLSVVTHAAYLFVSSNVLHNTLFISPDFPCGKRVCVRVWVVCVYVCPAEAPAWVFIGPSEQRFPASFEAVSLHFLRRLYHSLWFPEPDSSCLQRKVILLTQSHQLVMTTLSFLDSLGQSGFYFDMVCYASLPVEAFIIRSVTLAVFPDRYSPSLQSLHAVFELHPRHTIWNKKIKIQTICFWKTW